MRRAFKGAFWLLPLFLSGTVLAAAEENSAAPVSSAASAATRTPLESFGGVASWLLSTMIVLAVIFVAAWLIKKTRFGFTPKNNGLKLMGQLPLGQKVSVLEVEAHGRRLLLGVTPSQVSFLYDLSKEQDARAFEQELKERGLNLMAKTTLNGTENEKSSGQD